MAKRYTSPFAPLQLTHTDATQLEALAHAFVRKSMAQYERFAFDEHCAVDDQRWRFVLERDDVTAFTERRRNVPNEDAEPDAPVTNAADMPVLMLCGTLSGTLNDAMLGSVTPTLDWMRIKTSYIDDQLVGCAVLATLAKPTLDDPFRSLAIKWFEKGRPLHVRALVKNRDFVYMEATGISTLTNGERVGYHLMHSVHFPQTPELDTVVRGNMSVCGLYRQRAPGVVEVYARGVLNPAGGLMRSIIVKSAATGLVSLAKYMHCAAMRKLVWLLRHRHAVVKTKRTTAASASASACSVCGKQQSALKAALIPKRRATCRVCRAPICSACKRKHKLSFLARATHHNQPHRLVQSELTFCSACVAEAARLDAFAVATDEFVDAADAVTWSDAYADSASSSSSSSGAAFSPNASEAGAHRQF